MICPPATTIGFEYRGWFGPCPSSLGTTNKNMPFAINGFGTAFCGQCDYRPDGSFVTTEWITLCFVPTLPLRSFRLIRTQAGDINVVIFRSESYGVLKRLPLCGPQVLRVYLFMAGAVGWWVLLIWLVFFKLGFMSGSNVPLMMVLMLVFFCLLGMPLVAVVWLLRRNSKERQGGEPN